MLEDLTISGIRSLGEIKTIIEILSQITRFEKKKTFPACEQFPFGEDWGALPRVHFVTQAQYCRACNHYQLYRFMFDKKGLHSPIMIAFQRCSAKRVLRCNWCNLFSLGCSVHLEAWVCAVLVYPQWLWRIWGAPRSLRTMSCWVQDGPCPWTWHMSMPQSLESRA